jgi:hypothetical protein
MTNALCVLDWFRKYEALAVWIEGFALVGIFGFDIWAARRDHQQTLAQIKLTQDQIKLSQNAERAWVMTELVWPEADSLRVVLGASRYKNEPQVESTQVAVKLVCKNEGRSPAWVDKIQGYCELVEGKLADLPTPVGHEAQPFLPIGPIGPGGEKERLLLLEAPGQAKHGQLISLFVLVEYRDPFGEKRVTTCGYTVSGIASKFLERQDQFPNRNRHS